MIFYERGFIEGNSKDMRYIRERFFRDKGEKKFILYVQVRIQGR